MRLYGLTARGYGGIHAYPEFFALAKLTRWVTYGTPSDEFKKANADFHPIYHSMVLSDDGIGF